MKVRYDFRGPALSHPGTSIFTSGTSTLTSGPSLKAELGRADRYATNVHRVSSYNLCATILNIALEWNDLIFREHSMLNIKEVLYIYFIFIFIML